MKPASAYSETAVRRIAAGEEPVDFADVLAVEEPLEIRIGFHKNGKLTHKPISITMRTPGDDAELAAGFLFTEGIIRHPDQVKQIRHCGLKIGKGGGIIDRAAALNSNTIRVDLNDGVDVDLKSLERHFYTTSSCGVCGKSSIEALHTDAKKIENETLKITAEIIHRMPKTLIAQQKSFEKTGGLHASALFDADGELDMLREDVGRHNALDKVIGAKFMAGEMPLKDNLLIVSGRASFELVQKALMAGIPILTAVGAPSSLAVELAREFGMTLIGFVRDDRFNIYAGQNRLR
ncbi:MAG: formate dehydrogenase accessory sulfurtransferase FdhD [Pyrinomonadaceae bacterium]